MGLENTSFMGHNPQTFEDSCFSRDAAGQPAFPPRELKPCLVCGSDDSEICKLLGGHLYPLPLKDGPQGNPCGTENAGENTPSKPLKGHTSK